jgi:outer membrane protein assembly factor BamE (lipoprotein component of BamABCDE complex)
MQTKNKPSKFRFLLTLALPISLTACLTTVPANNEPTVADSQTSRLSYGLVQQVVKKGASKDKVIEALGAPNMVTNSSNNEETWIYDKISSTVQAESTSAGGGVLAGGAGGNAAVGIGASMGSATTKATTSQRTLTVIIKFKGNNVDSYTSRTSSF